MHVQREMLLDLRFADQMPYEDAVSSSPAYQEVYVEGGSFTLDVESQVEINVSVPLATYHYLQTTAPAEGQPINFNLRNAACRLYLDGTAFDPVTKQWNAPGGAIMGGGQWNFSWAGPCNGRMCGTLHKTLPAGVHTLRTHLATSGTDENILLMGPRWYQVSRLVLVS
jgi:hypothetical protein